MLGKEPLPVPVVQVLRDFFALLDAPLLGGPRPSALAVWLVGRPSFFGLVVRNPLREELFERTYNILVEKMFVAKSAELC